jgi:drug/metabolite transporter (DMT)-like permease
MTGRSRSCSLRTNGPPVSERRRQLLPYVAFATLGLIWGASFLFIKVGVQDMSPTVLVLIRAGSGAIALAVIMRAMGRPLGGDGWKKRLPSFIFMAFANALIPWVAIAWGEQHISSGLASILNSTTTLWAAIFIYWVIPAERPSIVNYAGVLLGILGVVILVFPDISTHGLTGNVLGVLAVLAASMSYAVSALYQRTKMRGMSVYEQSLGQLALTALIAIPFAAPSVPQVHLAFISMAAVIALGVFGSGVAYLLYYYTMNTLGPVRATGVTFVVPITAVFWGIVLLHESLSIPVVTGMLVILGGVVLTNLRRRRPRPAIERESAVA